jgi:hypothetical protein
LVDWKLSLFSRRDNKHSWWNCKCSCGTEKVIMRNSLIRGLVKSCGCYNKELSKSRLKQKREEFWNSVEARLNSAWTYLYKVYKRRAKEKQLPFELTQDQFRRHCGKSCYYCGDYHSNHYTHTSKIVVKYNGLDRVDNDKGYTEDNIQTLCITCNKIKSSMSEKRTVC